MQVAGDCLAPDIPDGAVAVFDKTEPVRPGDICIFVFLPHIVVPGMFQCMTKRLVIGVPPYVTFPWREHPKSELRALVIAEQMNPPKQYMVACDKLMAIHRFVGLQPAQG